jgi:hypothetical protein
MKTKIIPFILVFIFLSQNPVFAQADTIAKIPPDIYGALSFDLCTNGVGYSFNGTCVFSNNWGVNARLNCNAVGAKNLPDDYYDLVLIVPFLSNGIPTDMLTMLSFSAVKEFPLQTKYLRFGIEFGPSIIIGRIAEFTPVENIPFIGSNYDMTRETQNALGFSFRGKIESPFTRFIGAESAVFTNLNGLSSVIGIDFCITFGMLR